VSTDKLLNRRKILSIHNHTLIHVLNEAMAKGSGTGIPDGTSVVGVWFDHTQNAFDIVLVNQAFEEVPEGVYAPKLDSVFEFKQRKETTP